MKCIIPKGKHANNINKLVICDGKLLTINDFDIASHPTRPLMKKLITHLVRSLDLTLILLVRKFKHFA